MDNPHFEVILIYNTLKRGDAMQEFNIGEIISNALEFKGISQKEAAILLEIPYSTFNNYVRNQREPDFNTLIKIFSFLEIDMNRTFGLKPSNDYQLNSDEIKMIKLYRSYTTTEQGKLLSFVDNFIALLNNK